MSDSKNDIKQFKDDLRTTANLFKQEATIKDNDGNVRREIVASVYANCGVTQEMVENVRAADSLIANASNLAAGELAHQSWTANTPTPDARFTLSATGFGRDSYEAVIRAQAEVGVGTKETRGLQLSTGRWNYHNTRGGAEHTQIKQHLTEQGVSLLAAIAKAQQ